MTVIENPRVACFATQGSGSQDEDRIKRLLAPLLPEIVAFERGSRLRQTAALARRIRSLRPDIVVMEGTGVAGGSVLLALRLLFGQSYIVSSGDAVGPFLASLSRPLGMVGVLYEGALCRLCSGFIGWSPYLVGRALTFGAPRAMTAPNWSDPSPRADGAAVRRRLGIAEDALVFGIVGSLNWNPRLGYCYGLELVRAALRIQRPHMHVLVVGDGTGRAHLSSLAGDRLGATIHLPGAVPRSEVPNYLAAIDVASLPQSVDGVGAFRYTTKISEYLAAGLPIVTGEIPLAYDLDEGWLWRLPGDAPWDERYITALQRLMTTVTGEEITRRHPQNSHASLFDASRQQRQVTAFVRDIVARNRTSA